MTAHPSRVLILGYGEMGHALEHLLAPICPVRIWQRQPPPGRPPVDLDQAAADSDFLFFCVPADPVFALARRLASRLAPECLCITIAKGLDAQGRVAPVALAEGLGGCGSYAALYGPMISEEILAGKPGFAQCAGRRAQDAERLRRLFAPTRLCLEPGADVTGAAWGGVLKNVYALAFGMADELGLGDNMRGFLAVVALREMAAIIRERGGAPPAPLSLSGLGDLVTTATSAGSHHHALGRRLARREREAIHGEGVNTLARLREHALVDPSAYPLLGLIEAVVRDADDPGVRLREFLGRWCRT